MTKKETIKKLLTNNIFKVSKIEEKAEIRNLKLHEYLNGKAKLSSEEETKVLTIIRNSTKLKNI